MEENGGGNLFELFRGMIETFDPCMDDYLYVFDADSGICENAADFGNATGFVGQINK